MKSISVIICAYNHDKWIERCLRSVLNQEIISKEDFEVPETVIVSPLDCEKSPNNSSDIDNQDNLDDWGLQDDNW